MQVVFIDKLRVETIIGVHAWERVLVQALLIDVELHTDMTAAFASDDVADVIDYQKVCADIERICHQTQAKLVEHLADKILTYLFDHYPVSQVSLKLTKPNAIKAAAGVGVRVVRSR